MPGDHWGARVHVGSGSEVTAPSSLLSGWDQFLIGNACVGMRWRDDITISEHIPCVPRLLWSDWQFISLKAPPLRQRERESERVVECYWLLWSLKIAEFHWCCNRTNRTKMCGCVGCAPHSPSLSECSHLKCQDTARFSCWVKINGLDLFCVRILQIPSRSDEYLGPGTNDQCGDCLLWLKGRKWS